MSLLSSCSVCVCQKGGPVNRKEEECITSGGAGPVRNYVEAIEVTKPVPQISEPPRPSPNEDGKRQSDVAYHIFFPISVELPDRNAPLTSSKSEACQSILKNMGKWEMDTLSFADLPEVENRPLTALTQYLFQDGKQQRRMLSYGLVGHVPSGLMRCAPNDLQSRIFRFIEKIEVCYQDLPYHCSIHAADVMVTMERFLQSSMMLSFCSTLDHVVALIVGAIHDVGHTGTNNAFHVNTASQLALRYNDRSPLENMHVALAFEIMQTDELCRWIQLLETKWDDAETGQVLDVQNYVKKMMISMVLATDNMRHGRLMEKWGIFLEQEHIRELEGIRELPLLKRQEKAQQKQLVLDVVLHTADVSNPCKPLHIALAWTKRLCQEVWAQGDEEARLGIPISMLCDRKAGMTSVPQSQIGFITFFISPLYKDLTLFMAEAAEAMEHMQSNLEFWKKKKEENATFEQLFPSTGPQKVFAGPTPPRKV
eukprot:gnl/TRDRNA2_/TRDRNA2_134314_c0_seq1.p1 gnl/TRDRNA2_/TRDRNA2_134314_c0~~gnl/TRDRNA2_/TRDRNA2_134314_c0_seq1.p1  ORF type:complete len:481 (-),score=102.29 gnl/TRDRNA2_/TRDRNA2_134314_c0_seq1:22-1464(-)